jgi:hypothetical protein
MKKLFKLKAKQIPFRGTNRIIKAKKKLLKLLSALFSKIPSFLHRRPTKLLHCRYNGLSKMMKGLRPGGFGVGKSTNEILTEDTMF